MTRRGKKRRAEEPLEQATKGSPLPKRPKPEDPNAQSSKPTEDSQESSDPSNVNSTTTTTKSTAPSKQHRKEKVKAAEPKERDNDDAPANGTSHATEEPEEELNSPKDDEPRIPDEEEEQQARQPLDRRQARPTEGYDDLYLDTIDRRRLDFDFEKLCSITLSNLNIYACLVCGKYLQGRGPKTKAYFHALESGHHPYINLETKRVYILPEGYEVKSATLDDIKFVADPWLPRKEVFRLDEDQRTEWDLFGRKFTPGFVGLNNIKANDYFSVVIHALSHVSPLRNFMMCEDMSKRPQLAQRFALLVRKLWNPRMFKAHVSPHELLQEVTQRSNKRYSMLEQSDPAEFLSWFLNHLHLALGGSPTQPGSSIIQKIFQGRLKLERQAITSRADIDDRLRFEDAEVETQTMPFMILTLDLPPTPLFTDELDKNFIPQVPLTSILNKYNGLNTQEMQERRVRFRLQHPLPPYLIFHIKRFSKNKFIESERNPTIVTFSTTSLDMTPYVEPNPEHHTAGEPLLYDLAANITHEAVKVRDDSVEGESFRKVWRVNLLDKSRGEWLDVQDLFVDQITTDTVFTKEAYVQIWERRKAKKKSKK